MNIFVSYSHKDKKGLDQLKTAIAPLLSNNQIDLWDDNRINPGEKWEEEIAKALEKSKIAILLVSPNFLASSFITQKEIPQIFHNAEGKGLIIFWICLSSCAYVLSPINKFQCAHDPAKPLDQL